MIKGRTTILVAVSISIVTFLATSYFLERSIAKSIGAQVNEMEAFNEIWRIESWERIESLLVKGCYKEAIEFAEMHKLTLLTSLKNQVGSNEKLLKMVTERSEEVAGKIKGLVKQNRHTIPSC